MMTIQTTDRFLVHLSKQFACYVCKLIDFLFTKLNHVILTQVGFGFITLWSLSRFVSNHKKVLL